MPLVVPLPSLSTVTWRSKVPAPQSGVSDVTVAVGRISQSQFSARVLEVVGQEASSSSKVICTLVPAAYPPTVTGKSPNV